MIEVKVDIDAPVQNPTGGAINRSELDTDSDPDGKVPARIPEDTTMIEYTSINGLTGAGLVP